jgi:hypothetical protein
MSAQPGAQQDQRSPANARQDDETEAPEEYLDRDKLDFDPDDGLYSGTAVDGSTEIPGPHERDDDDSGGEGASATASEASDDERSSQDGQNVDDRPAFEDSQSSDGEPST